ncbi:amino acid adenylation domain-containing protein [Streptomyces sp. NPDC059534]|uniref:non-ribosomal peptide synthetase n=1 Tax=Streptomyces sp. NPDC059534 TaxID=3346859 RepID=UPI0036B841F3
MTFVDLLERLDGVPGDREAVIGPDRALTFAQLRDEAGRLAGALRARGLGPEHVVAVSLPRGADLVVALIGVLMAGAAYLPVEPGLPAERRRRLLEASGASLVLADRAAADAGADGPPRLTPETALLGAPDGDTGRAPVHPDQLAYVIYTSGSTGEPKGVQISRGSATALIGSLEEAGVSQGEGGRVGWNASVAFDASVQQWTRLCRGDTLVIVPDTLRADPAAMTTWIADQRLTALDITPSHLDTLLDHWPAPDGAEKPPLTLLVGGEAISPGLWKRLVELREAGVARAVNLYGPTECTVDATAGWVTPATEPHLGGPLPGVRLRLGDPFGRTAAGEPGAEILLAGTGVARGYLGRPGQTAERFLPDEDGPPGSRCYRTGDLARRSADGSLEYLGRSDHQVKLRGYRIEPGEIAAVLTRQPEVAEAVVVLRDDLPGGAGLVGYCKVRAEVGADAPQRWRAACEESLPGYMVPAALVTLEKFPLTANGKLDRAALPRPDAPAEAVEDVPASEDQLRGPVEQLIAQVWSEVLGSVRIRPTDSFFRLGGHSLLAIKLVARLKQELGLSIRVTAVYEHPELRSLAAHIETTRAALADGEARGSGHHG